MIYGYLTLMLSSIASAAASVLLKSVELPL